MINKRNAEISVKALQKSILDLHGCKSTWVKSCRLTSVLPVSLHEIQS